MYTLHPDIHPIRRSLPSPDYGPAGITDSSLAPSILNDAGLFFPGVPNPEPMNTVAGPSLTCGFGSTSSLILPLPSPASCPTSPFPSQPASEHFNRHVYSDLTSPAPFPVPLGCLTMSSEEISPLPEIAPDIFHGPRPTNGQTAQMQPFLQVSGSIEASGASSASPAPSIWPAAPPFEQGDMEGSSVGSQYMALAGAYMPSSPTWNGGQCQRPQQSEPFNRMPILPRESYMTSKKPSPHLVDRGANRYGNTRSAPRVLATEGKADQDKADRMLRASRRYRLKMARECNEASEEAKRVTLQHELLMRDVEQLSKEIYNLKAEVLAQSGCGCPLMQAFLTHEAWQTYGQPYRNSSDKSYT